MKVRIKEAEMAIAIPGNVIKTRTPMEIVDVPEEYAKKLIEMGVGEGV